jgi:hypothetical protein
MSQTQHQWFQGYAIKQKAPENCWTAAILLFYILQKYYPTNSHVFLQGLLSGPKSKWRQYHGASVTHVTPVRHVVNTLYRTREIMALLCSTME